MKPQRIQLRRSKGWRKPPGAVKVDRTTVFGNPFKPILCTPAECVATFRRWLEDDTGRLGHVEKRATLLAMLPGLRGRDLACWCPLPKPGEPDVCHAAVLLEVANA